MEAKLQLQAHGIKVTKQRLAILDVLTAHHVPLSLNQIRDALTHDVDLSTLYRTLDTFFERDLIEKTVPLEPSQTVYELKRLVHKHHLICMNCGLIKIVEGCPLHDYEHQVEASSGFVINRHQLELYGLCPHCQEKR